MADPKLLLIMKVLTSRLKNIRVSDGYRTDIGSTVVRSAYAIPEVDWPACSMRLLGRTNEIVVDKSTVIAATITINGYAAFKSNDPEDVAIWMLSDIQQAIEVDPDKSFKALLRGNLSWQSDIIIYPEGNDTGVSVQVEYNLPHIRKLGDPEK